MSKLYVAGADFGTDSVRVVLANVQTGKTAGEGVCTYPRWAKGLYCDPAKNQFRQHPSDYLESFTHAFLQAVEQAGPDAAQKIAAIGFDATGSTPAPVNKQGVPLALLPEFAENPNAMFYLWKDHTAQDEAAEINRIFGGGDVDFLQFQGPYQSEWYWAKALHAIRTDPSVRDAAYTWVEQCDWMPALLAGNTDPHTMYHCTCAAGHKMLWHSSFGGFPYTDVLAKLDPILAQMAQRYPAQGPQSSCTVVGTVCKEWADRLGIGTDVLVAGSSLDAHAGGVGAGVGHRTLVKVLGTSSVDMMVEKSDRLANKDLRAYVGMAENSIIPGFMGVEAGQAAFGDVYAWFRDLLLWPVRNLVQDETLYRQLRDELLFKLENSIDDSVLSEDLLAIDWFNGRRFPVLNEKVKGALAGLTLGTSAPQLYHSLIVATVFGAKRMFEGYISSGIEIERIIVCGGIAKKIPLYYAANG